ncbi:ImmA/IrrE family metallo-endopeptidase [Inquilinus sp. Marseille-Q2685]|uniref:ImmA/IrrE family metallo-endopeptidase n=1 Tax=Inquilinus sp. Marseille-Q2685 TaxID=2866581 RepID=UPI001CE4A94A|nr:ImmA/IrrE family metallo-endopeptidase [Inquilinus sp. Marseille-Q2685]
MLMIDKMEIIKRHQNSAPVDVFAIAKDLGLSVYLFDDWPDDLSGVIAKDSESPGGYLIGVNGKHARTRQRFTVAHEIAHFVLHEELIGDGLTEDALYRSRLSNSIEAQANRMAADILMPWKLINQVPPPEWSVKDLARRMGVSPSSMAIRLGVPYETSENSSDSRKNAAA